MPSPLMFVTHFQPLFFLFLTPSTTTPSPPYDPQDNMHPIPSMAPAACTEHQFCFRASSDANDITATTVNHTAVETPSSLRRRKRRKSLANCSSTIAINHTSRLVTFASTQLRRLLSSLVLLAATFSVGSVAFLPMPGVAAQGVHVFDELHIGGIFPINGKGGWQGGQACMPAAQMALEDVNDNQNLLRGFKLTLHHNDSEVS